MKEKKKIPELRFPGFSGEWVEKKIGDYVEIISGIGFKASEYSKSGIPLLRIDNVSYGKIIWESIAYLPEHYLTRFPNLHLKAEDILLALNRPITQGQLKISKLGKNNEPSILYQRVGKFVFKSDNVLPSFAYFLFSLHIKAFVEKTSLGSDQPFISTVELKKYSTLIPFSKKEQTKIANFLSDIDSKIEKLTKKKELMEQYKKGMMQTLFSREIRFKDENGNDYPDWEEKIANEIFDNITDKNHNGDLPLLAVTQDQGVVDREAAGIEIKTSQQSIQSYKMIDKGDFVISLRSFQGGIEYSNLKGISSPAYTVLRPKIKISDNFYKAYFKKEEFISKLNNAVIGIRDGKQISYGVFSDMRIPYPSFPEQEKIANFLNIFDKKIEQIDKELCGVKEFKKGLLQKMFV